MDRYIRTATRPLLYSLPTGTAHENAHRRHFEEANGLLKTCIEEELMPPVLRLPVFGVIISYTIMVPVPVSHTKHKRYRYPVSKIEPHR
jgi:hypothetical protein